MLIAICGAGFLVCILAILLLIISYIRSKSFLLPGLMFLLGFVAIVGSLVLEAGGFLEQAPEDETNTAPITDDAGEEEPPAGPETISNEPDDPNATLQWLIEADVSTKYDGYTLNFEDSSAVVSVWRESITRTVEDVHERGGNSESEDWVWLKDHTKNSVDYILDCIQTSETGISDLTFNVYKDEAKEDLIMAFTNDEIIYDALAEDPPAPKTSRTTTSTARQQPAPVPAPAPEPEEIPPEPEPEVQPDPEPAAVPLVESTGPQLPPDEPGISGAAAKPVSNNPQLPPDGQEIVQTGNGTGTAAQPANGPELPKTDSSNANVSHGNLVSEENGIDYVLNWNTMKFHDLSCHDVEKISRENRQDYRGNRDTVLEEGFSPCGHCDP